MSLEDAKQVVKMTRFHPIGRRPCDGGNADGAYCGVDFLTYIEEANRERFIIVQIEDPEPLAELDAIAALPGIDMLLFGPGDFTHSIGHPAEWDHPLVHEARRKVAEAARAHGKFAGTVGSPAGLAALMDMGYQFVSIGADVVSLWAYCKQTLTDTQAVLAGRGPAGGALKADY